MKKLFTKEFIIGLSVVLALVVLFFGIEYLKGINLFKPANYYKATYSNVSGLETAAPVKIEGFKVGQVREINFDYSKPGNIEVVFAVDKALRIPEDSKALIASTLLGGSFVDIKLGKSSKMLEIGDAIDGLVAPDMMASVTDELLPSVQNVMPKVDSLLINLNRLVSDPALAKSIQSLDVITQNLSQTSVGLNSMMKRDMPRIMGSASGVAQNLDTITTDLIALSAQLKSLPLNKTVENVNDLTANLLRFSDQLNNRHSTLGMLMNDPELYNRLNTVAADVDSLLVDIKKNPKRYISIKLL